MGPDGTDEIAYLAWDTSELSPAERDAMIEETVADLGADVGLLEVDDLEAVGDAGDLTGTVSAPGPRAGGGPVDPELVLIVLESTLIAIEAAKIGREAKERTSGMGPLVREKLHERLRSRGQSVETGSAGSIEEAVEQSSD